MLTQSSLQKIKLHYTEEYNKTLSKLKELEAVLMELGDIDVSSIDLPVVKNREDVGVVDTQTSRPKSSGEQKEPVKRAYKKRSKKRGRKSVWGEFILKRLKSTQKPLSYDDLANHAIVIMKLDKSDFEKVRKSIIGAVFSLRTKQEKVSTISKDGTRNKYVLLKSWVDEKNKMLPEFKDKL